MIESMSNGHTTAGVNSHPNPKYLRVVIIGAGIGGLTAALFLRNEGHHVTVVESSTFANEVGAALHLAPNANGLLRRLGIFGEDIGANLMQHVGHLLFLRVFFFMINN
jgi:2-polyprenyl-6-methoxyphenol hydroxylase-like FAD-dependent oxidoreductase